jgi:hypothetical protein
VAESKKTPKRNANGADVSQSRTWQAATAAGVALLSVVVSVVANVGSDALVNAGLEGPATVVIALAALVGLVATSAQVVGRRAFRRGNRAAAQSERAFREAATQAVTSVEQTLPSPGASLEEEISEVSSSLSMTIARLRQVSEKAEAFEAEVKELVERADVAKATASLHEDDARKIGRFLGSETERRLRSEIDNLTAEYNRQIDSLRRSGNRTALWTFIGGVVLGTIGNVVVALLIR